MKKRIFAVLCAAIMSVCILGCDAGGMEYRSKELRIFGSPEETVPQIPLIRDIEQKNEYIGREEFQRDDNLSFRMHAGTYGNDYFEENDLIIMSYLSCASEIKRLYVEDTYLIIEFKKNKRKHAACEYAPVAVFIEIDKLPPEISLVRTKTNGQ